MVFKLVGAFRRKIIGQNDFLHRRTLHHRLGQFSLKYWTDVFKLELARQPLSHLLHMVVHTTISALTDVAPHAVDIDRVHVRAFWHRQFCLTNAEADGGASSICSMQIVLDGEVLLPIDFCRLLRAVCNPD